MAPIFSAGQLDYIAKMNGLSDGTTAHTAVLSAKVAATIPAWGAAMSGINQVGVRTTFAEYNSTDLFAVSNAYFDGTNWRYIQTAAASYYYQSVGTHAFRIAPSGTAGAVITWSQPFFVDNSGNIGLGGNPIVRLDVNGVVGIYDGGSKGRNGGMSSEAGASLVNFGINDGAANRFGGAYTQADQGGFLRVDTRSGQPLFQWYGRPATAPSASQVMSLDWAGLLTIAGQIAFPATQNASSGANILDDYEEGTFTPGVQFGGAAVGMTFSIQNGYYTKVGNRVLAQSFVNLTAKGSSTGGATLTGLPFAASSATNAHAPVVMRIVNISFSAYPQGYIAPSGTIVNLEQVSTAGALAGLSDASFTNTASAMCSYNYSV